MVMPAPPNPNWGALTKSQMLDLIREGFPNLSNHSEAELIDLLPKCGIEIRLTKYPSTPDEAMIFYFESQKERLRMDLRQVGKYTDDVIEAMVNDCPEWIDTLKMIPSKEKP
jgi:hypothetical protein